MEYKPYCYLIGWSKQNLWYYGCQVCNSGLRNRTANPENLWTTYFTSSKIVAQTRKLYGEPDIVRISKRKLFTSIETKNYERAFLRRVKAAQSPHWLNQTNGDRNFYNVAVSEEHKNKINSSLKGRTIWAGKKHTEITKALKRDITKQKWSEGVFANRTLPSVKGSKNPAYDHCVYTFQHDEYGTFIGARNELVNAFKDVQKIQVGVLRGIRNDPSKRAWGWSVSV